MTDEIEFRLQMAGVDEPIYVLKGRAAEWAMDLLEIEKKYESLKVRLEQILDD